MKKRTKHQLMTKGYTEFYKEMYLGSPHFDEMRHHFPDVAHNLAYYAYNHGYNRGWTSHTNSTQGESRHPGRRQQMKDNHTPGSVEDRLEAAVKMDVINGDNFERSILESQIKESIIEIRRIRRELGDKKDLLSKSLKLLKKLADCGTWYPSALEIDAYSRAGYDGEDLYNEIMLLLTEVSEEVI